MKSDLISLSFDEQKLVEKLLGELSERARIVLTLRYGLTDKAICETLESIGKKLGITRERVRQLERAGLDAINKTKAFQSAEKEFEKLRSFIESRGSVIHEEELLKELGGTETPKQNRFRFLLVVGSPFFRERETEHFYARWHIDSKTAKTVHQALTNLYNSLSDKEVLQESELMERFLRELKGMSEAYQQEEILKRWLTLSKTISKNPLSEWGRAHVSGIKTKGIRDLAYLVMKKNGKPMHFKEVANAITQMFAKRAHMATTHNELMKDSRFVLVGRGLYALSEWGFTPGVVREVISRILKEGPKTKAQIIDEVKKVRMVKETTISMNLNDRKYFAKKSDGTYALP